MPRGGPGGVEVGELHGLVGTVLRLYRVFIGVIVYCGYIGIILGFYRDSGRKMIIITL